MIAPTRLSHPTPMHHYLTLHNGPCYQHYDYVTFDRISWKCFMLSMTECARGMLMSIPQCIKLGIPNYTQFMIAYKILTKYLWKFQWLHCGNVVHKLHSEIMHIGIFFMLLMSFLSLWPAQKCYTSTSTCMHSMITPSLNKQRNNVYAWVLEMIAHTLLVPATLIFPLFYQWWCCSPQPSKSAFTSSHE